jgi:hypothetical protein
MVVSPVATIPYPKNKLVQCNVFCTPYPKAKHPAGTIIAGKMSNVNRDSGWKTPPCFLACRSEYQSTRGPPTSAPHMFPRKPGILMRPFTAGDQEYGGAWRTKELRMLMPTTQASANAVARMEKMTSGYTISGHGRRKSSNRERSLGNGDQGLSC